MKKHTHFSKKQSSSIKKRTNLSIEQLETRLMPAVDLTVASVKTPLSIEQLDTHLLPTVDLRVASVKTPLSIEQLDTRLLPAVNLTVVSVKTPLVAFTGEEVSISHTV